MREVSSRARARRSPRRRRGAAVKPNFQSLRPALGGRDAAATRRQPAALRAPLAHDPSVCGIVLAGSYSWGDGAFERRHRGPALPVAQIPAIRYPLAWLRQAGVGRAVICGNGSTRGLDAVLRPELVGLDLRLVDDPKPRGPAGCARDATQLSDASVFVVVEGSLLPSVDLRAVLDAHRAAGAAATLVVETDRRHSGRRGMAHRLPGGIYVFERHVLESVPATGFQDIKEGLLARLHARDEIVVSYEMAGVTPRILDYASYVAASAWLIGAAVGRPDLFPDHDVVGESRHHRTARVHPDARLIGPVLLGADVRIEGDAVVVGPTSISAGSVVRPGASVSRSILWERCTVGRGARLDAAFLGHDVTVHAGAHLVAEHRLGRSSDALDPRATRPLVPGGREPAYAGGDSAADSPAVALPRDFSLALDATDARLPRGATDGVAPAAGPAVRAPRS